jgi:hypothetical protein
MINKLTQKQKQKLKKYRDKYIRLGLNIKPINKKFVQKIMNRFYEEILKRKSVKVIICDNPLQAYYMCYFYKILKLKKYKHKINEVRNEVENEVWKEVRNEVENEVGNEVRNEVGNEVENEVWKEVESEVRNEVWKEVENEVRNEVRNEVGNEVWNEVENEVGNEVWNEVGNEVWNEVRNEVENEVRNEVWNEVWNEVRNEVENEVWNEVENEVGNEVWNEVENEVRNEVWNEVENEVRNEVWNEVWNEVGKEVGKEVRSKIKNYYYPYLYGSFDANYFSYYNYFWKECNIKYKNLRKYKIYSKLINFNFIHCLKDICFISQNSSIIRKNLKGQLHADENPALKYKGLKLWRLNGIKVPKYIVMTPYYKLSAKKVLQEKNVEVRREGIRKIGIHRCINELKPIIIDTWDEYELLSINFTNNNRIYLKMKNPSINTWHIEAVHPSCDTVKKALAWRDGEERYKVPNVLT